MSVAGTASLNDGVTIGGGARVARFLTATQVVTFARIPHGSAGSAQLTVSGVNYGDAIVPAIARSFPTGTLVSATIADENVDVVYVTILNFSGETFDPGTVTIRVDVWQH